jgi:hypothetical protein
VTDRPRVKGQWEEPSEDGRALFFSIGRAVYSAGGLESSLLVELMRIMRVRATAEGKLNTAKGRHALSRKFERLEKKTAGQLLYQLRELGLDIDVADRIDGAIKRRNHLVHDLVSDVEMIAVVVGQNPVEPLAGRIERLAVECGELAVELQVFAKHEMERETGMTSDQLVKQLLATDPALFDSATDRARLEALRKLGDPGPMFELAENTESSDHG